MTSQKFSETAREISSIVSVRKRTNVLSIDIGETFGFCVSEYSNKFQYLASHWNSDDISSKIYLTEKLIETYSCKIILVECPPQTIYYATRMNREKLIGKATRLLKLAESKGWLMCCLDKVSRNGRLSFFEVLPSQWQYAYKSSPFKQTKSWSIAISSDITKKKITNHNEADAICISYYIHKRLKI